MIPPGPAEACGSTHSVNCCVVGLKRPTLFGVNSVKYRFPSGPVIIAPSPAFAVGTGISVTLPVKVIRPIRFVDSSVNQIAPSGPTQIALGPDDGVKGNSTIAEVVVTVRLLEPVTVFDVAIMLDCPTDALLARPVLVMVATVGFDDTHVATLVTSCTVPSVNVPAAANCCAAPNKIVGFEGLTAIDTSAAGVTVRTADPDTEPDVAVMVVDPVETLVTRPALPGVLLTVATGPEDDVQ